MTPDWAEKPAAVPFAIFADPQSLNMYEYVVNNPESKVDPDGHLSLWHQWGSSGLGGGGVIDSSPDGAAWAAAVQPNTSSTPGATATTAQAASNAAANQGQTSGAQAPTTSTANGASQNQDPDPCSVTLPTGQGLAMVQTLMGEQTAQSAVGTNQYADDESGRQVGPPGGTKITNATLDREANLMAGTMLNLGHIGDSKVYRGLPAGITKTEIAEKSAEGSAPCTQLHRDIDAVKNATPSAFSQWGAVNQGFIRELNGAIRVAGTDFIP